MLDLMLSRTAVTLLNRMLSREAWARERLRAFSGKVARFDAPPFSMVFMVTDEGLCRVPSADTTDTTDASREPGDPHTRPEPGAKPQPLAPDVTLELDATALPQALFDPKALMRNVRLSGDAEFAQALGQVLPHLRLEPEEELAPFFGDAIAVRMVSFARSALAQARDTGARLAATTVDYFVAENPMLAARAAAEAFASSVVDARDAVARLEQRIELLERR